MVKQVIIIRKDLKMRRGKEIAQGAHASGKFLAEIIKKCVSDNTVPILSIPESHWILGNFKKVTLQVDSEAELLAIYTAARAANIKNVHLITDSGLTEFDGIPTITCLAIGPDCANVIDQVTGNLKLY